jgi:hypothetical protein
LAAGVHLYTKRNESRGLGSVKATSCQPRVWFSLIVPNIDVEILKNSRTSCEHLKSRPAKHVTQVSTSRLDERSVETRVCLTCPTGSPPVSTLSTSAPLSMTSTLLAGAPECIFPSIPSLCRSLKLETKTGPADRGVVYIRVKGIESRVCAWSVNSGSGVSVFVRFPHFPEECR